MMKELPGVTHTIWVNRPNGAFVTFCWCALAPIQTATPSIGRTSPPSNSLELVRALLSTSRAYALHLLTGCPERTEYGSLLGRESTQQLSTKATSATLHVLNGDFGVIQEALHCLHGRASRKQPSARLALSAGFGQKEFPLDLGQRTLSGRRGERGLMPRPRL